MIQKHELPEELRKELGLDDEQANTEVNKKMEEALARLDLSEEAVVACSMGLEGFIQVSKQDLEDLIYYADTAVKILKENGWPGKAEALEWRYMKLADAIGLKAA